MYDMNSEWDRYMLRYDGYSAQTLEGFVAEGKATHDDDTDSYTVTYTGDDGAPASFTVTNTFGTPEAPAKPTADATAADADDGDAADEPRPVTAS